VNTLDDCFYDYLNSEVKSATAMVLAGTLKESGLVWAAEALRMYIANNSEPTAMLWNGRPCVISANAPLSPATGEVWFDPVEILPMIMCPHPEIPDIDQASWVALHPVQAWQFRTFLRMVKIGRKRTEFPHAGDYLEPARFAHLPGVNYVTNVYHDEGLAYTIWFGKTLGGDADLYFSRAIVTPDEFRLILPEGMRLWDVAEYSPSEFTRRAIGADTIDKNDYDEAELYESGENVNLPNRMLFDEWETRSDIGISSSASPDDTLHPTDRYTLFFDIDNAAPRPAETAQERQAAGIALAEARHLAGKPG
jgi:hypothetical protein